MLHCSHGMPINTPCLKCFDEGMLRESARHKPKSRKAKTCKCCGEKFIPDRDMQPVCGLPKDCQQKWAELKVSRAIAKRKVIERRETREKLSAMATLPELKKKAQKEFNAFIRARDEGKPCICCGRPLGTNDVGGNFDCGHFRSVGSAPHLRFNEDNAHGQTKACNRYGAGRAVDYRIGLIARIGIERVEALEADQTPRHYTREHLLEIAETYRKKKKLLLSAK